MNYASTVLADSPIRYYRLGESSGTTAVDIGSQAQNGTLNGGITLSQIGLLTGDTDTAMLFNGSTGYISLPTTGLPTGASAFTMECWIKISSQLGLGGNYEEPLAFGTRATNQGFSFWFNTDGTIHAGFINGGDITGPVPTLNTPHHLVATYDGTTLRFYVDGVSVGTPATTTGNIVLTNATIGVDVDLTHEWFPGVPDEVAFYPVALTSGRVAAHYTAGTTAPVIARPKNVLRALTGLLLNRAFEMRAFGATLIKRYQPAINTTAYASFILTNNHPTAYYRVNEASGSVAYDASGNSYHAHLTGVTAQSQPGAVGDGDFSTLFTTAGGITLPPSLHIEVWPTFGLEFWIFVEGVWEYVGVDWDGTTTTVYRNGAPYTPGPGASVGIEQGFAWAGAAMAGKLDEIALYPRLTSAMAAADYAAGSSGSITFIPRAFSATLVTTTTGPALSGTLIGQAALSGTLSANLGLGGTTMAGIGALSGTLSASLDLGSATQGGIGTLAGTLAGTVALAVTFAGSSTDSATLSAQTPLVTQLSGVGQLTPTFSANVAMTLTLAGVGTLTGALSGGGALAVTFAGNGTLTGPLSAALTLSGITFAGAATLTGPLTASFTLSGATFTGTGTLTGGTVQLATALTLTANGAGSLSGPLSASYLLASITMPGSGTLAGTVALKTALADTMPGVGTFTGAISAAFTLSGATMAGIGQLTGAAAQLSTSLADTLAASGTLTGAALTLKTALTDTIAGIGQLTGALSGTGALAVQFAGTSSCGGVFSLSTALAGSTAGAGTLTATLSARMALTGTLGATGSVTGVFSLMAAYQATLTGTSTLSGTSVLTTYLMVVLPGSSGLSGTTTRVTMLSIVYTGVGQFSPTLLIVGAFACMFAGISQCTGALSFPGPSATATWKTRDLATTWKTRDTKATWVARDDEVTWKTRR